MIWKMCSAFLLILTISACSLNQAASESVMELTPASLDVTATFTPTPPLPPTATRVANLPTVIPSATPIPTQPVNVNSNPPCTVTRIDLPVYTVAAGDTLSNIARRTNSTVTELAQINCLSDASLIAVGQQLRVPKAPSTSPATNPIIQTGATNPPNGVTLIDTKSSSDNAIEVSPYLSNKIENGLGHYTVRSNTDVTLRWTTMPTNLNLIQVEFLYVDDHYTVYPISIGIDTNLADGASIVWSLPEESIQGRIYTVSRIPGQLHEGVQSTDIIIQSLSDRIGPRGAVSIDPYTQAGTPADWGDYVVAPNSTVTITWSGIDPTEFAQVGRLEFQYYPDSGGIQILGHDTDKNDGMSITWEIPAEVSGRVQVGASFGSNGESWIYSPEIHVRTQNTDVVPCKFNPFGIGGDIPVYGIPNLNTEPIHTIQMGTTYPVMGSGYQTDNAANGLFYHLDFGDFSGWVRAVRGELLGDCQL